MPMSNYALDTFVSQYLSELGPCILPSITEEFPEHVYWINNFILNSMFRNPIDKRRTALAFALLRRAEAACEEWELARETLAALAHEKKLSGYFRALRHLENAAAALYQGYEFGRVTLKAEGVLKQLFKQGEESSLERLCFIYNRGRHYTPTELPTGDLHAVWIANDGLHAREKAVSFDELMALLREASRIASALSSGKPREDGEAGSPAASA